ncbi:hypothetical protein RF11_16205 [Thelohanellus kitauei]|uniref:Uncharacterized protein n=1 Tax=Thelohanellus kitauei TaxID=669202 RepID=A0A0C2JVM1_THEKT|nr:hypothetical protein RF11_16205 [Thelohanellus kitauei]
MISWVLFVTDIPRFMVYKASKYEIEACYRIIKKGERVLVGFRFPAFNSTYPPLIFMTIEQAYRNRLFKRLPKDMTQFQLIFHSIKCNETIEISNLLGDDGTTVSFIL